MTMTLYLRHLPPEFEAARRTLMSSFRSALPTSEMRRQRLVVCAFLMGIGAAISSAVVLGGIVSPDDKDFWRSSLTMLAVLSGFMVTTMVFTGRVEVAKSLSLSELREVADKSNHLLLYQIGTLVNHLACLSIMLLVVPLAAKSYMIGSAAAVVALTLLIFSLIRSALIPLQIMELHRFTHAALLREKAAEANEDANEV